MCRLVATRTDGAFAAVDAVPIELEADGAKNVILVVSDGPIGGMGIGIEVDRASRAIRVTGIMEGSPAQRAGLAAGDLILAVGGVSTEGMDAAEFAALGTGPVGTDVTVKVEHNGRVTTTTLSRWSAPADQRTQP
jgi:C-terminal processing protease CtpA/Prc